MAKKPLNIGMVGYGFMGRAHSNAYRRVGNFFDLDYQPVLKAACGRNRKAAKAFADMWGYESVETDWKEMIKRDDIDAVDICVPNDLHAEIATAAAKAGKIVLCEKPLARDAREGERMVKAVEKAGVANMVWYNYRWIPAVTLIKQVVDDGHGSARSSTTAPTSCRTGRSLPTCRRAGRGPGASTWRRPAPASPAT